MQLAQAETLARELMAEHLDTTWTFKWSNGKGVFGHCNNTRKQIALSKPLTELNNLYEVNNVILHEIAHALTPGHHHDNVWRLQAKALGCTGDRTHQAITPPRRWLGTCGICGNTWQRHRRPTGAICPRDRNCIIWKLNV